MSALSDYLSRCRAVHENSQTTESSYYSALEALFDAHTDPRFVAHSELILPARAGRTLESTSPGRRCSTPR